MTTLAIPLLIMKSLSTNLGSNDALPHDVSSCKIKLVLKNCHNTSEPESSITLIKVEVNCVPVKTTAQQHQKNSGEYAALIWELPAYT